MQSFYKADSNALRDIRELFRSGTLYTTNAMMRDISTWNARSFDIYEESSDVTYYGSADAVPWEVPRLTDEQIVQNHRQTHLYRKTLLENDIWATTDELRVFVGFNPFVTDWNEVESYCEEMHL